MLNKLNRKIFSLSMMGVLCIFTCSMFFSGCMKNAEEQYVCYSSPEYINLPSQDKTSVTSPLDDAEVIDSVVLPPQDDLYNGPNLARFTESESFSLEYFYNLRNNLPLNNVNNCGYVAMVAILSYYSVYWNSSFVPDEYLPSNPVVLSSVYDTQYESPCAADPDVLLGDYYINDPGNINYRIEAIYSYINTKLSMVDESFVSYFYNLADANGIWSWSVDNYEPGLTLWQVKSLLELHLNNVGLNNSVSIIRKDFEEYDGADVWEQRNRMCEEIVSIIQTGKPVIIGGLVPDGRSGFSGHITIAYDVQEDENSPYGYSIYGHTGGRDESYVKLNDMFMRFDDFLYLDVDRNMTHQHYRIFDTGGFFLNCSCALSSHTHKVLPLAYGNPTYHVLQCMCGLTTYERHINGPFALLGRCICGYRF